MWWWWLWWIFHYVKFVMFVPEYPPFYLPHHPSFLLFCMVSPSRYLITSLYPLPLLFTIATVTYLIVFPFHPLFIIISHHSFLLRVVFFCVLLLLLLFLFPFNLLPSTSTKVHARFSQFLSTAAPASFVVLAPGEAWVAPELKGCCHWGWIGALSRKAMDLTDFPAQTHDRKNCGARGS